MSLQTWGVRDFNTKHRKDCEARVQDEQNGNIFQESSKEVGKQYFRVTNDFCLMKLTMMKGGT